VAWCKLPTLRLRGLRPPTCRASEDPSAVFRACLERSPIHHHFCQCLPRFHTFSSSSWWIAAVATCTGRRGTERMTGCSTASPTCISVCYNCVFCNLLTISTTSRSSLCRRPWPTFCSGRAPVLEYWWRPTRHNVVTNVHKVYKVKCLKDKTRTRFGYRNLSTVWFSCFSWIYKRPLSMMRYENEMLRSWPMFTLLVVSGWRIKHSQLTKLVR